MTKGKWWFNGSQCGDARCDGAHFSNNTISGKNWGIKSPFLTMGQVVSFMSFVEIFAIFFTMYFNSKGIMVGERAKWVIRQMQL